jgi:hypothetical protein
VTMRMVVSTEAMIIFIGVGLSRPSAARRSIAQQDENQNAEEPLSAARAQI